MRWIEIVTLRAAAVEMDALVSEIQEMLAGVGRVHVRLFRNPAVGSDISVHVHLETADEHTPINDLGEKLARTLEDYGLVSRTLWQEIEALPEKRS